MKKMLSAAIAAGTGAAILGGACGAVAQKADEFYRGKTVTIVVSTGPGGGYDLYSRTLSQHISRHIAGSPNFILTFMPGAGGMKAASHLANVAPKDGSVIAMLSNGLPLIQALRGDVRFDVATLNYIGRIASQNAMTMVASNAPATTLEAARDVEIIFGGTGKAQQSEMHANSLRNVVGFTKFRIVGGYKGSAAVVLAMENGEVHAQSSAWSSWKTQYARLLQEKKIVPLVEHGIAKSPDNPGVPLIMELARNDLEREVLTLINSDSAVGRNFALPPDVPADRIATMRAAFTATMKDREFLADAEKRNLEVLPMTGEDLQKLVLTVTKARPEVAEATKKALGF